MNCPICESANTSKYWDKVWMAPDQHVSRCGDCGLFFLYPYRSAEEQRKFDAKYAEYIKEREKLVESQSDVHFATAVDESIRERFRDIEGWLKDGQSLVEVGAERGGFLELVRARYSTVVGVDACPEYRDYLMHKGYRAHLYVEDLPAGETFDRICFFSLLEHLSSPVPFLTELRSRLSDKGLMVLEVPSAADPLLSLYDIDAFKDFYFQAMHPYVYSLEALKRLFDRCELEVVDVRHKQRYGLANHLQWLRHGIPGGNREYEAVLGNEAQESYRSALERKGVTDTLYLTARKR